MRFSAHIIFAYFFAPFHNSTFECWAHAKLRLPKHMHVSRLSFNVRVISRRTQWADEKKCEEKYLRIEIANGINCDGHCVDAIFVCDVSANGSATLFSYLLFAFNGTAVAIRNCGAQMKTELCHCVVAEEPFKIYGYASLFRARWTCQKPINYYLILNWVKNEMHALPLSAVLVGCWSHSLAKRTYSRGIFLCERWVVVFRAFEMWTASTSLCTTSKWYMEKKLWWEIARCDIFTGTAKSHPPRTLNSTRSNLCRARMRKK